MSAPALAPSAVRIKCGHCKNFHVSVEAVKGCYRGEEQFTIEVNATGRDAKPLTFKDSGPLASEKQLNFLRTLCEERGTTLEYETDVASLRMGAASQLIRDLIARPKAATAPAAATTVKLPDVPAGHYALRIEEDGSSIVKFFRVDRPTEGKWKGRTFLKVQASDDFHSVRDRAAAYRVLELIAADPAAASKLYGTELGKCGVCNRTLTDETSRANGIGPVCAEKSGW